MNTNLSYKPFIIPIFIPHRGCPNRCIFCNQVGITGVKYGFRDSLDIKKEINLFLKYFNSKKRSSVQVSFYGGNFLGLPEQIIEDSLNLVSIFIEDGLVNNIRFSTRPDTINAYNLSLIQPYLIKTVELGVQSMNDKVLELSKRGHTSRDVITAVDMLKLYNYEIGIQIMLGLPGDDENKVIQTVEKIAALSPSFVRIYPTIVLRNSFLSVMYHKGEYIPLNLHKCVSLTKKILLFFNKCGIPVIRMGLQHSKELEIGSEFIAGPYHPAFGHMVYSKLFLDVIRNTLSKTSKNLKSIVLGIHPKNVSKVQGLKKINLEKIKSEFFLDSVKIQQCQNMSVNHINICGKLVKIY